MPINNLSTYLVQCVPTTQPPVISIVAKQITQDWAFPLTESTTCDHRVPLPNIGCALLLDIPDPLL